MSKMYITENEMRKCINESIKELIDEGFFDGVKGYFSQAKDTLAQGWKNDMNNIKDSWNNLKNYNKDKETAQAYNDANLNYRNAVKYYGKPCTTISKKGTQTGQKLLFYVHDRAGNYDYILGLEDYVNHNNVPINNDEMYKNNISGGTLSFNTNGRLYKDVVEKYIDTSTMEWKQNDIETKIKLIRDLKNYRNMRTKAWENTFNQRNLSNSTTPLNAGL